MLYLYGTALDGYISIFEYSYECVNVYYIFVQSGTTKYYCTGYDCCSLFTVRITIATERPTRWRSTPVSCRRLIAYDSWHPQDVTLRPDTGGGEDRRDFTVLQSV